MTRFPTHRRGEDGSLLMSMLAVLMVTTIAVTLFAYVVMGNRTTRQDRSFQTSVTGADAGLHYALTDVTFNGAAASPGDTRTGTGTIGDVEYTWTATKSATGEWDVEATGTAGVGENVSTRTFVASITQKTLFSLGAFADLAFVMRGSNDVLSYDSSTGATNTGLGSIGSNGTVSVSGNGYADVVYLFAGAVCDKKACDLDLEGSSEPFDIESIRDFVTDEMAANCAPADFESYTASSFGPLVGGNTYCFTNMDFDVDTTLSAASSAAPVRVFVSGNISTDNHVEVNCPDCSSAGFATPDAGSLQIYSSGSLVAIGNHNHLAGAIAAPNASCEGNPSNAQATVYGSIVCADLTNQGGWAFRYDVNLTNLTSPDFDLANVREETN